MQVVSTTTTGEAVKALKSGTADAVVFPASKGTGVLKSLTHDNVIHFLEIPKEKIDAMAAHLPQSMSTAVLPAKTYKHQDRPVPVFSLLTYLVADSRLGEDTVYRVTKALFENL